MTAIQEIAAKLGLTPNDLEPHGSEIAKVRPTARERLDPSRNARLVLVSAITPTPAGEGKTTTSIGLAQGLARLGKSVCVTLREPSLGPCFGKKGGGAGGGKCQVLPSDRINLHFTGDLHAVTAAHNLLASPRRRVDFRSCNRSEMPRFESSRERSAGCQAELERGRFAAPDP